MIRNEQPPFWKWLAILSFKWLGIAFAVVMTVLVLVYGVETLNQLKGLPYNPGSSYNSYEQFYKGYQHAAVLGFMLMSICFFLQQSLIGDQVKQKRWLIATGIGAFAILVVM